METHIMQSVNAATDPITGSQISYDLFMPYCCLFIGKFVYLFADIQRRDRAEHSSPCHYDFIWICKRVFRVNIN